jgi:hypothetical protein
MHFVLPFSTSYICTCQYRKLWWPFVTRISLSHLSTQVHDARHLGFCSLPAITNISAENLGILHQLLLRENSRKWKLWTKGPACECAHTCGAGQSVFSLPPAVHRALYFLHSMPPGVTLPLPPAAGRHHG